MTRLEQAIAVLAVVSIGSAASYYVSRSDFAQDYLAARAARAGLDPNAPTAELAQRFGVPGRLVTSVQQAHPPFATLLASPFSYLEWPQARVVWQVALAAATAALLVASRVEATRMVLLAPAWIFGLWLGNIESAVVGLCLLGFGVRSERWSGVCLGAAAALKVYPVLLILGFLAASRYRTAVAGAAAGFTLTFLATAVLGFESFVGWLKFIPGNGDIFNVSMLNLSLTKVTGLLGWRSFIVTSLGLVAVVLQRRRGSVEPLLGVILLTAPVAWLQSLPLVSNLLTDRQAMVCGVCSSVIAAGWFLGGAWMVNLAIVACIVMTAVLVKVYADALTQASSKRA